MNIYIKFVERNISTNKSITKLCILISFLIININWSSAQNRTISGTVISEDDMLPLPGVTVLSGSDKTIGTITDLDGKYSISVHDTTLYLIFSFIGMETQIISLNNRNVIDIVMKIESLGIDEIVISVPYAVVTQKDFSGSVSVLHSKQLGKGMSESIDKSLQGMSAGLVSTSSSGQPGAKSDIRIRGIGSFQAGNEPLYVIDGVAMSSYSTSDNILSSINPNDIESITVCKDAASASLYGSRASNGIILITTKSGLKNETKYNISVQQALSNKGNTNFSLLNTDDYLIMSREALSNSGMSEEEMMGYLGSESIYTDWLNEVYRTAYSSNYEISVSGGSDNTSFYLSGNYKHEEGIVIASQMDRLGMRLNLDYKPSDKIEIGTKINGTYTNQDLIDETGQLSSPIVGAYLLPPNVSVYNTDGSYNFNVQNVVGTSNLNKNNREIFRFIGNVFFKYNFTKYLNFKTTLASDYFNSKSITFIHPLTPDGKARKGIVQNTFETGYSYTSTNILSYDKRFRNASSVSLLGGYELQDFSSEATLLSGSNFVTDKLNTIEAASVIDFPKNISSQWAIMSYLASAGYVVNSKYNFTASARRDYCSRFSPENRAGNFWSLSGAWQLSEEQFLKNKENINLIKLRLSYGTSGNADIGDYAYQKLYALGHNYNSNVGISLYQLGNENLTWEKNNNADFGIDFKFFRKLSGTIEFYHRTTWDLLMNVPISFTNGAKYVLKNYGEMVNKGVELHLKTQNIQTDFFIWETDFNISVNHNEITKLYNNTDIEGQTQIRRVGEAYYTFYMPEWAGVNPADGLPLWFDSNGDITQDYNMAAKKVMGKADPLFVSGISNTFIYKNFELSAMLFLSFKGLIYNGINQRMINDGSMFGYNQSSESLNRWQQQGDVVEVPKPIYNNGTNSNQISSRYLEDRTYLRLRNMRLSYNFSQSISHKLKISNCKIFVEGNNIWTWAKYSGIDPEVGINGIDNFSYPSIRTFLIGLTMNF